MAETVGAVALNGPSEHSFTCRIPARAITRILVPLYGASPTIKVATALCVGATERHGHKGQPYGGNQRYTFGYAFTPRIRSARS